MVMKVVGSKAKLFAAATLLEPERLSVVPRERLGPELVKRVFARRDVGAAEPWSKRCTWSRTCPVRRRPVQISADATSAASRSYSVTPPTTAGRVWSSACSSGSPAACGHCIWWTVPTLTRWRSSRSAAHSSGP